MARDDEAVEQKQAVDERRARTIDSPKKTNLGDSATIKRILDDAVVQVVLDDSDEGLGYVEDSALSNLKLVVGFAGVGASLVSHVYPAPFPKNWLVLLLCCAWYFLMSGILQLILSFCELESILLVRGKDGGQGLNFSSHLPRFQEMYTLGITPLPKGSMGLASAPKFRPMLRSTVVETSVDGSQKQWPVNHFFDEDGNFAEDAFISEVRAFVKAYQSKKRQ
mmetsp:Transcript_773/g.1579  ORF Transcript_773/g.1579 Transcript_773/m.1579 type:complete len:222 (+) Transcript_773:20-685(+)